MHIFTKQVMHKTIAHHLLSNIQSDTKLWQLLQFPPDCVPSGLVYYPQEILWYRMSHWPVWVSCLGIVSYQIPVSPTLSQAGQCEKLRNTSLAPYSTAQQQQKHHYVISAAFFLKLKLSTLMKTNSVPSETRTVEVSDSSCSVLLLSGEDKSVVVIDLDLVVCSSWQNLDLI